MDEVSSNGRVSSLDSESWLTCEKTTPADQACICDVYVRTVPMTEFHPDLILACSTSTIACDSKSSWKLRGNDALLNQLPIITLLPLLARIDDQKASKPHVLAMSVDPYLREPGCALRATAMLEMPGSGDTRW